MGMYMHICAIYKSLTSNMNRSTVHVLCNLYFMLLTHTIQQIWLRIAKRSHANLVLYRFIEVTLVYIGMETQPTAMSTSHDTVIHVPETNMSWVLHVYNLYPKYMTGIYRGCMCISVSHMKSLMASTVGEYCSQQYQ